MTAVDNLMSPKPDLVKNGRYQFGGESFQRVTNFVKLVEDRWNLEKYFKRMVALGIAARPDLYALAGTLTPDDKRKLDDLTEQAIEAAKGSAKANLGTALHAYAEQIDRGQHITVPDPWAADIAAYVDTMQRHGVHVDAAFMERVIVNRLYGVAGRFDRIVSVDGHPKRYIADIKTGGIDFGLDTIAAQLHVYASAEHLLNEDTGELEPMVDVDQDRALIIHLPVGQATCSLLWVSLADGRQVADMCRQVRDLRRHKTSAVPLGSPLTVDARVAWLTDRVGKLKAEHPVAFTELAANWPDGVPTFKQGGHSEQDAEMIALAVSAVEANHGVSFGDPDPARAPADKTVVKALVERITALPDDLAAAVKDTAKRAGVPNLSGRKATVSHVAIVTDLVEAAERAATERAIATRVD